MRRRTRLGIIVLTIPVLLLAVTGVYALVGSNNSGDGPPLPGFALVRPLFAQADPAAFPVDDAGISAYAQVDPASIDFDLIITTVFNGMIDAGDNYIIGTVPIDQGIWNTRTVDVNLYVDIDGWMVAYLNLAQPVGEVFTWTSWSPTGATLDTTLEQALERTAAAVAQLIDPAGVGWYYWADPAATNFAAAGRANKGDLYMAIPIQAVAYGKPSFSFHSNDPSGSSSNCTGGLTLIKLGAPGISIVNPSCTSDRFKVLDVDIDKGSMYTFRVADGSGGGVDHRLGIAVVYKAAP